MLSIRLSIRACDWGSKVAVQRVASQAPAEAVIVDTLATVERNKRRGVLWKVLASRNLVIGGTILIVLVTAALLAPWVTPYDPIEQDTSNTLQGPSLAHPFGTDNFGRDMFSRVVHGGRIDLRFGLLAVLMPLGVGVVIGSIAAYYGRWVDALLMRLVDIVQAFPFLVLVIFFVAVLGPGLWNMVFAVALVAWIVYARLIRGSILVEKNKEYVIAAKAIGGNDWRVVRQHLLPNVATPCIIYSMADIAGYIGVLATLSFLGLGERPPAPEWGAMIASGRDYMVTAWWICAIPGAAIVITGIALSLVGDGLADVLRPGGR
jgi:peptide/nickel transport system permease protein